MASHDSWLRIGMANITFTCARQIYILHRRPIRVDKTGHKSTTKTPTPLTLGSCLAKACKLQSSGWSSFHSNREGCGRSRTFKGSYLKMMFGGSVEGSTCTRPPHKLYTGHQVCFGTASYYFPKECMHSAEAIVCSV